MKISNFRLIDVIGDSPLNLKYKALVDVTVKRGFFRKEVTEEKEVFKTYGGSWYFIDTGKFVQYGDMEALVRKLEAEKGVGLEKCLAV